MAAIYQDYRHFRPLSTNDLHRVLYGRLVANSLVDPIASTPVNRKNSIIFGKSFRSFSTQDSSSALRVLPQRNNSCGNSQRRNSLFSNASSSASNDYYVHRQSIPLFLHSSGGTSHALFLKTPSMSKILFGRGRGSLESGYQQQKIRKRNKVENLLESLSLKSEGTPSCARFGSRLSASSIQRR